MKISEVADRSGIPASTLRYYERLGLLSPDRGGNGYRHFDEAHIERLGFIDAAKQLGLELPEIRRLLELADTGTCTGIKAALLPLLAGQIAEVEHQLETLDRLRGHLHEAQEHVTACPDSPEPCRSECAFWVLAKTAASRDESEDRNHRWRSLLAAATVTRDADTTRLTIPADRAAEVLTLLQTELATRPAASIALALDGGTCTVTIRGELLDALALAT